MRLTLRQLQIFTAVAETGSTTAAAERVALSQSATSGALNELENLLGTQLFDRIGRRLVLNDSGRSLLPLARSVLDGVRGVENHFGLDDQGRRDPEERDPVAVRLRVGASTTIGNYLLPPLMARHLRIEPRIEVDLTIDNTRVIAARVARLEDDVGFIEGPCHEPDVLAHPWLQDDLVIVGAPDHPLLRRSARPPASARQLAEQRWLLREPGSGTREVVESALLPHLAQWSHSMQLGSTEAIKQAAAEGLGLACLSLCAVADLVALGRLKVVRTTMPAIARRCYLIHHRDKTLSPSLRRFVANVSAAAEVSPPQRARKRSMPESR